MLYDDNFLILSTNPNKYIYLGGNYWVAHICLMFNQFDSFLYKSYIVNSSNIKSMNLLIFQILIETLQKHLVRLKAFYYVFLKNPSPTPVIMINGTVKNQFLLNVNLNHHIVIPFLKATSLQIVANVLYILKFLFV